MEPQQHPGNRPLWAVFPQYTGSGTAFVARALGTGVSLQDLDWRLIGEESRAGPMNMALDEAAAASVAEGASPIIRLYRWQPSTLSLGYHQDPDTIEWDWCAESGVTVTRRPTGGGAIYHDRWGDISYSIIVPASAVAGDLVESYQTLCTPILDGFSRMGIDASFSETERPGIYEPACYLRPIHPAHDITVAGQKISGNAQYRQRDVVIQHGSITYESDPVRHLAGFDHPGIAPEGVAERVTDVRSHADIPRREAVGHLEAALSEWAAAEDGAWRASELRAARALAEQKYASRSWTRDGVDPTE